jgi:trk system potassium uptake protein TrkA
MACLEHWRRLADAPPGEVAQTAVTIVGGDGLRLADGWNRTRPDLTIAGGSRRRPLASRLKRALVLNGDGTDLELLESKASAQRLVSVTDNDERNLLTSLLGRQLGARRVITRVSRRSNLRLFERVGIDVAISARGAAVASVLNQIEGGAARLLAVVEQGAGRVLELDVPAGFRSRALRDLPRGASSAPSCGTAPPPCPAAATTSKPAIA